MQYSNVSPKLVTLSGNSHVVPIQFINMVQSTYPELFQRVYNYYLDNPQKAQALLKQFGYEYPEMLGQVVEIVAAGILAAASIFTAIFGASSAKRQQEREIAAEEVEAERMERMITEQRELEAAEADKKRKEKMTQLYIMIPVVGVAGYFLFVRKKRGVL